MTFAHVICGAAFVASATAAGAAASAAPVQPKTEARASVVSALTPAKASVRIEYTDFSKLYGSRTILTADSKLGTGQATRYYVGLSAGQRRVSGVTRRAGQAAFGIEHDWTNRLSSRTSAAVASNGSIFAKAQVAQDFSYELGGGLVGTVGGKFATYGSNNDVTTWSAGAAYYLRGATLSYRFSLLDSSRLGHSTAHLGSFRLKDPGGRGATQLWVGHGTSLYDVNLPQSAKGKFTSVALNREQPLGGGVALNIGVGRNWYSTPTGKYHGTGISFGFKFVD